MKINHEVLKVIKNYFYENHVIFHHLIYGCINQFFMKFNAISLNRF